MVRSQNPAERIPPITTCSGVKDISNTWAAPSCDTRGKRSWFAAFTRLAKEDARKLAQMDPLSIFRSSRQYFPDWWFTVKMQFCDKDILNFHVIRSRSRRLLLLPHNKDEPSLGSSAKENARILGGTRTITLSHTPFMLFMKGRTYSYDLRKIPVYHCHPARSWHFIWRTRRH